MAPQPVAKADLIGRTLGEFAVKRKIGQGGFGSVYLADQPLLGREAVVKVLNASARDRPELRQRFLREARLASAVDHPFAAHIYSFGAEGDGTLWIAMELVRGTPLSTWLKTRGPLPLAQFVPVMDKLCEVVHSLHQQGIVHRDLKPANVMVLSRAGRMFPKLLDLGIAKLQEGASKDVSPALVPESAQEEAPPGGGGDARGDGGSDMTADSGSTRSSSTRASEQGWLTEQLANSISVEITSAQQFLGSPGYMAPEQWTNPNACDARTDVYALGVLTFQCLMGRLPFRGADSMRMAAAHLKDPVPPLDEPLPAALSEVVRRAMAKRPEERYPDALSLASAIRAAAGESAEPAALPELDPELRETALQELPQPLAEALATFEAARTPRQALLAVIQLVRVSVRYVALASLACRARMGAEYSEAARESLQRLARGSLTDHQWWGLAQELCRPYASYRDAFPVPELVELCLDDGTHAPRTPPELEALLRLESDGAPEAPTPEQLHGAVSSLEKWLRRILFLRDYPLARSQAGLHERWTGLRRHRRSVLEQRGPAPAEGALALIDASGSTVVSLHPLVQAIAPSPGAPEEVFFLEGTGRYGAKLHALPLPFERHDEQLWGWLGEKVAGIGAEGPRSDKDERAPYLGLASFTTADAENFFGRERDAEAFANRLRVQPLLGVVGPSGAGKSSFIQAGVVPLLPAEWRVLTVRPGPSPIAALAHGLFSLGVRSGALREALRSRPDALREYLLKEARSASTPLLLVVDQFEELLTLCPDESEQRLYAEALARAASAPEDPVRVVLTLRDDFLIRAQALPALHDRLPQGLQLLSTPARDDLLRIVTEPARRAGYSFESPDLPEEMVQAVHSQSSALALVSFTASKLWDLRDRERRCLTRKAYAALGGVGGALAHHAEATLAALPEAEQRLVREAFRHLVTAEGTRAVLSRAEIVEVLGGSAAASALVDALINARLLVSSDGGTSGDRIEVIHEALLSSWPRVVRWQKEDAENLRVRDQLRAAARQWEERSRKRDLLWRGETLMEYRVWRGRYDGRLTQLEREFAEASLALDARGRRARRGLAVAAFAVLTLGLVILFRANLRANAASQSASDRLTRFLAEQGRQLSLTRDPLRALPFLESAFARGADSPGIRFLIGLNRQELDAQVAVLSGHAAEVVHVAFSPDGQRIATASTDGSARLWTSGGQPTAVLSHRSPVFKARFTPDGGSVLTVAADGELRCWSAEGTLRYEVKLSGRALQQLALDPAGRWAAAGGLDGAVYLVDVASGREVRALQRGRADVMDLQFTPDGRRLVSSNRDQMLRLWRMSDGALERTFDAGESPWAISVSPDGARLAMAGLGRFAKVWELSTGRELMTVSEPSAALLAVAFAPDGRRLALGLGDGTIKLYSLDDHRLLATLKGRSGRTQRLLFNHAGDRLLSAVAESVSLWDLRSGLEMGTFVGHTETVKWVELSPDERRILTAGRDGTARLWDSAHTRAPLSLHHDGQAIQALFSADGHRVVTDGVDRTARVWDSRTGEELARFDLLEPPASVAISPDGEEVVAGAKVVQLWSVSAHRAIARLPLPAGLEAVTFFPDGKHLLTASDDHVMRVWDLRTLQVERAFPTSSSTENVSTSADGRRIAAALDDNTARVWDAGSGQLLGTFKHAHKVYAVAFSHNGALLATGALDRNAITWDIASGRPVSNIEAHEDAIYAVAFSPDDKLLLTASQDSSARIWELQTGLLLAVFPATGTLTGADFSPDGTRIVTAPEDGDARIWLLPHGNTTDALERYCRCHSPFDVKDVRLEPRAIDYGACFPPAPAKFPQ